VRGGTTSVVHDNAEHMKALKLAGLNNYVLCAAGDAIEAVQTQSNLSSQGKVDGYAIVGIVDKGYKSVTFDGLQATPGVGAVAAGDYVVTGTVVAAGTALKNIKFDGPKFATGGIISGPVIGEIGEMHRPEVILPLDRLPQMLRSIGGGGGNDMQLIPIINNEGLYLAMKRGERRTERKF